MIINLEDVSDIAKALNVTNLLIHVKEDWGSDHENYSQNIKDNLRATLDSFKGQGQASISHTEGAGGFALLPDANYQIGFDIELRQRVRPAVVNRICKNPQELAKARLPENLWVAKESSFKAFIGPTQPKVISDIEVNSWTIHSVDLETFLVVRPEQYGFTIARGCVLIKDEYCLGVFICKK